jgi:ribosomal protein S26
MSTLSKFGRQETARTHDEARAIVCCVCGRKVKKNKTGGTVKVVNEKLANLVRKFVFEGFSVSNTSHPTAICVTCRLALCAVEKVYSRNYKNNWGVGGGGGDLSV